MTDARPSSYVGSQYSSSLQAWASVHRNPKRIGKPQSPRLQRKVFLLKERGRQAPVEWVEWTRHRGRAVNAHPVPAVSCW